MPPGNEYLIYRPISWPAGIRQKAPAQFPGVSVSASHDRLYLEQVCARVLELTEDGLRELRRKRGHRENIPFRR